MLEMAKERSSALPAREVVVCAVGREYFALPLESIAEIYKTSEITPLPLSPVYLVGVVNVHGSLASVLSLAGLLGLPVPGEAGLLLILTPEYGAIALQVDGTTGFTAYGNLEEVAREPGPGEGSVEFVEGVFRDGSKLVSLINPEKLRVWIDSEFTKGED